MYAYVCDGCGNQVNVMGVSGADVQLCYFCRDEYRNNRDFRDEVKEWAEIKRDNNVSRKVLV